MPLPVCFSDSDFRQAAHLAGNLAAAVGTVLYLSSVFLTASESAPAAVDRVPECVTDGIAYVVADLSKSVHAVPDTLSPSVDPSCFFPCQFFHLRSSYFVFILAGFALHDEHTISAFTDLFLRPLKLKLIPCYNYPSYQKLWG